MTEEQNQARTIGQTTPTVEELIQALAQGDDYAAGQAALALGASGDERAIAPLIEALRSSSSEASCVYTNAKQALGQLGKPALTALLPQLDEPDSQRRYLLVYALGAFDDERVLAPLLHALKDSERWIWGRASESLFTACQGRFLPTLLERLSDPTEDIRVREGIAFAMVFFRDQSAIAPLLVCLRSSDKRLRTAAALALGRMGDQRVVEPLIARLRDRAYRVRIVAAQSLGAIDDVQAVEPLEVLLDHRYWVLRLTVLRALIAMSHPRAHEIFLQRLLSPDHEQSDMAKGVLWQARMHTPEVVDRLRALAGSRIDAILQELDAEDAEEQAGESARLG